MYILHPVPFIQYFLMTPTPLSSEELLQVSLRKEEDPKKGF